MGENGVGVTVTLREIYDAAQSAAKEAAGGRTDVAALRRDFQTLDSRLAAVERAQKQPPPPAPAGPVTLKQAAYAAGVVAAAVASAWGTARGVG